MNMNHLSRVPAKEGTHLTPQALPTRFPEPANAWADTLKSWTERGLRGGNVSYSVLGKT